MSLYNLIDYIYKIAEGEPNINTIIKSGNIYDLNSLGDVEYRAFCVTQQPHNLNGDWITYNFYMFVVDRLLADKSNKLIGQSSAIETLTNIINVLKNNDSIEVSEAATFHTFTQRFSSECMGAYVLVSISLPISDCSEDYE